MKILVDYGYYADILECPTEIGKQINQLQYKFDKWLVEHKNEHNLWFHDEIEGDILSFGAQDFADWINKYYIKDLKNKVTIIATQIRPSKEDRRLPVIYI